MSVYRQPKEPFVIGELRTKTWRTLQQDIAQNDKTWAARCAQYWNLQARLYGVQLSNFAMLVDNHDGFVSTYATVLDVLPGERTLDYSRVPVEAAGIGSLAN